MRWVYSFGLKINKCCVITQEYRGTQLSGQIQIWMRACGSNCWKYSVTTSSSEKNELMELDNV
jgi:hypothetical protein